MAKSEYVFFSRPKTKKKGLGVGILRFFGFCHPKIKIEK